MPNAALVSLATSVPPHVFLQKDVLAAAWDVFRTRFPEFERFSSIFSNTGIIKRHAVKPFDWYLEPRGWPERTAAFLAGAEALFVDVAGKALADAHLTGADIDTVVTVSSTGIATPSLEARVAGRMGFRSDVMRVPVFGLGCAGGSSGLSIAARLAQARPGTNVLLVAIELCSLALRHDELTKANIVAVSLFGDGAAAVCCVQAMAVRRRSRMPANTFGRIRLALWAGASIPKGSGSSSAAPSPILSSRISTRPWCRFSPLCS
jgi:alkylresorcinol/alkylpyrone synthase